MRKITVVSFLVLMFVVSGCGNSFSTLFERPGPVESALIYVEIHFADGETFTGYVKTLGMESKAPVYVGGNSVNNVYDREGNIIASYNYQRVNYMKILPEVPVQ